MRITYSKATVGMAKMQSRNGNISIYGRMIIENNGISLRIEDFSDIGKAFGITTHKLLCAGLVWFTKQNNIGDDRESVNEVLIPLRRYALLCGHKGVIAKDENDRRRATESLQTVRKQVAKDLQLLLNSSVKWQESTKGKKENYECPILLDGKIKYGYIYMTFSDQFAQYLKHRRITEYPEALFSVDNRKPNAYRIGQLLACQYYNKNNKKDGNFNKLRVQTLLAYTNLPTIETVRKERGSTWKGRIKEPLEKALNELVEKGVISKWEFKKKEDSLFADVGGGKMKFEEWADSLIYFTCKDDPKPQNNAENVKPESPVQPTESPSDNVQTEEQVQQPQPQNAKKPENKRPSKDKSKSVKKHSFYRKKLKFPLLE
ncbi:MAG: hypothetical protein K2J39_13300 [Ruminococcus sp.]|nr:hypothetical protein [Ruminococcus sp.]